MPASRCLPTPVAARLAPLRTGGRPATCRAVSSACLVSSPPERPLPASAHPISGPARDGQGSVSSRSRRATLGRPPARAPGCFCPSRAPSALLMSPRTQHDWTAQAPRWAWWVSREDPTSGSVGARQCSRRRWDSVGGCPLAPAALLPRGTRSRAHSAAEDDSPNSAALLSANSPSSACDVSSPSTTPARRRGRVESWSASVPDGGRASTQRRPPRGAGMPCPTAIEPHWRE